MLLRCSLIVIDAELITRSIQTEDDMRRTIFTTALMLLLPGSLSAQTPEQSIEAALLKAQQVGIPVSLLESKMAEGKAKGVSADRIVAAVNARLAGLERAQAALAGRGTMSESDLALGGDAVQSGVSEAVLSSLADAAQGERRGAAIAALTELVQMGHAPEHALERVIEALGAGPDALANLPAQAQQRRGERPAGIPGASGATGPHSGPPATVPAPGQAPQSGNPVAPKPPVGGRPGGE
jgi:hypothetical protein